MNRSPIYAAIAGVFASTILVGCGGGGGGLSDPGLSNVQVEVGNARSATITHSDGGTITATGSNGFIYTLTIPPGAIQTDTQVAMYPIAAIKNLPAGSTISGGVNFTPEGLQLTIPAKLTIQAPSSVDPNKAVPIAYSGNSDFLHLELGTVTGQTITTRVYHFSGTALGNRTIADLLHSFPFLTNTTTQFQHRMADAFWRSEENNTSPLADYNLILRNWYDIVVHPKLTAGGQPNSTIGEINKAIGEYSAWLDGILYAQRTLGDPAFNVQPQNGESEPLAVTLLKRSYQFWNDGCVRQKNSALNDLSVAPGGEFVSPLYDASIALDAGLEADEWHIPRAATALDDATLLNNLCVKVVIESKTYDGNAPGDDGTAKVKAGFTIDGGAARHDAPIRVRFSGNGNLFSGDVITVNGASADKGVHWPPGIDPLKIDILASLKDFTDITVFDRITKSQGQESLVIAPSNPIIGIGADVTLTATHLDKNGNPVAVDPSKLTWGISPTSVASIVPSGQTAKVTGLGAGTATVTVSLSGTSLTATSNVQVKTNFLSREYVGTLTGTNPDGSQFTDNNAHVTFGTLNFGAEGPHLAMTVRYGPGLNFGFSQLICSTAIASFAGDIGEGQRCSNTFTGTATDANHVSTLTWSFTTSQGPFSFTGTASF